MTDLKIFTDGSYSSKHNICGYGIYFPNKEFANVSEKFDILPLTNQRAELYAIYKALCIAIKTNTIKNIIIYSDSEYSIKSVTTWIKKWKINNWKCANNKNVKNLDIIKPIDDILQKYNDCIKFQHVRSHSKQSDELSLYNNKADYLAKCGANKSLQLIAPNNFTNHYVIDSLLFNY